MQYDRHVTQRMLVQATAKHEAHGCYPSADAYYGALDWIARLQAELTGVPEYKSNPMRYWYGRQSN